MTSQIETVGNTPLYVYRSSCVAMLRRYFQMSIELGRLPMLLGREFFRARSDTIREAWFEDAVIYVHDIERCMESLHHFDQQVIARVIFQDYTQEDAARLLHCTDRHLRTRLAVALDVLAQLFLDRKLMVIAKSRRPEHAVEGLSVPEEEAGGTDAQVEPAIAVVDELSAAAPAETISIRNKKSDEEWRSLPVEISCQAPLMSQIAANC